MAKHATFQSALRGAFRRIQKREVFESPPISEFKVRLDEAILGASLSKCVNLNLLVNEAKYSGENAFLFLANLRGVAEDLIVLQFLATMCAADRVKYLTLLQVQNLNAGLLTQARFFEANNPFQPVVGGGDSNLETFKTRDRDALRAFWKSIGETKKDGPTVRDMSERTGLNQTYEYIYFLSSNFVHFNPHALLRTGWGPEEGPFRFSIHNFSQYYADLASFYGAVLFVAFYNRLGQGYFTASCSADVDRILEILDEVPRWPELVTFEEINKRPPTLQGFLTRAMRKVAQEQGEDIPYGAILREARGLL
jgi:hypothetical protein